MTPCAIHGGISTTLCGCGSQPEAAQKPDTHRDFTELAVGTRVRFAHALREVEHCGQCRLSAVLLESKFKGVKRRHWIHDVVVGPTGYTVNVGCVEYVYPPARKRSKR